MSSHTTPAATATVSVTPSTQTATAEAVTNGTVTVRVAAASNGGPPLGSATISSRPIESPWSDASHSEFYRRFHPDVFSCRSRLTPIEEDRIRYFVTFLDYPVNTKDKAEYYLKTVKSKSYLIEDY